ncbi:MAG: hypothetical protein KGL39_10640 [Patescibacteria group bacterium]|nr:hypothetical protein [Patescibacteria group bacterium]
MTTQTASANSLPSQPALWKRLQEINRCRSDFSYFAETHCKILSSRDSGEWVPFRLWACQHEAANVLQHERRVVLLKARQLGFSWLVTALALWRLLFHPIATVLIFSKRDDEAKELLSERLRGMYDRLPDFLKARGFTEDAAHVWGLSNGSRAMAFPTTGGRSYTGTLVIVDEADFVPDLGSLLNAVKPTVDAGGQLVLLSTPDKAKPESLFKKLYRAAKGAAGGWRPVFFGWDRRPDRTAEWYENERRVCLETTGALDDLHQEYPATDAEALAPRTLDKRLSPAWLQAVYAEARPLTDPFCEFPSVPGLCVYAVPEKGQSYVLGGDPAEGNPQSDDSAAEVLDEATGEQVASLAGRFEPSVFAGHVKTLCRWYNDAPAMIERNNHGHAVLLWLADNEGPQLLDGPDDKPGWHTTTLAKARLYDLAADQVRGREVTLHSLSTYTQLCSVEGSTLRAPEGQKDDRAVAIALACAGRVQARLGRGEIGYAPERETLAGQFPQW